LLHNDVMVARIWRGYCSTREHADAYEAMLKPELLPGISATHYDVAATHRLP